MSESDGTNELGIKASSHEFSINARGGFVGRWGNGIADLFKFFGQTAGTLGDDAEHRRNVRRLVRIYDEKVLMSTLEHSLNNLDPTKPPLISVKPKFLEQWMEAASIEDQSDDENISVLWANLLSSAATEKSHQKIGYIRILESLDIVQARIFVRMAQNSLRKPNVSIVDEDQLAVRSILSSFKYVHFFSKKLDSKFQRDTLWFVKELRSNGIVPLKVTIIMQDSKSVTKSPLVAGESRVDFQLLENTGLIESRVFNEVILPPDSYKSNIGLTIESVVLTELGAAFYKAVTSRKIK